MLQFSITHVHASEGNNSQYKTQITNAVFTVHKTQQKYKRPQISGIGRTGKRDLLRPVHLNWPVRLN